MNDGLRFVVGNDTLVLNCDGLPISMFPISTVKWQEAIKAYYLGQADVLETYEDWVVHSPSTSIPVPAVIMTRAWVKTSKNVKFSRGTVYLRDKYTCQYCGEVFPHCELTFDHVKPRFLGGTTSWSNIVSACRPCNQQKSYHTVMKPINKPKPPQYGELASFMKKHPLYIRHPNWNNYLGWDESKVFRKFNFDSVCENELNLEEALH